MKWLLITIIVGVIEVATAGQLHSVLGIQDLILLYVATTLLGAFFLYLKLSEFKSAAKKMKGVEKKLKKLAAGYEQELTTKDVELLGQLAFISLYVPAVVLVAIPGVISDFVGALLVFPGFSSWLVNRRVSKAVAKSKIKPFKV